MATTGAKPGNLGLQKANVILSDFLGYAASNKSILQGEGFLRISGEQKKIQIMIEKIYSNPLAHPLSSLLPSPLPLDLNANDIFGVVKKAYNDDSVVFSNLVNEEIKKFIQAQMRKGTTPKMIDLVKSLIAMGAAEEAKFIHNMMHLGNLVVQAQEERSRLEKNPEGLMGPKQVATVLAMKFSSLIPDALSLQPLIEKEINETTFEPSFQNVAENAEVEKKLQAQYRQDIPLAEQAGILKKAEKASIVIEKAKTEAVKNVNVQVSKALDRQSEKIARKVENLLTKFFKAVRSLVANVTQPKSEKASKPKVLQATVVKKAEVIAPPTQFEKTTKQKASGNLKTQKKEPIIPKYVNDAQEGKQLSKASSLKKAESESTKEMDIKTKHSPKH